MEVRFPEKALKIRKSLKFCRFITYRPISKFGEVSAVPEINLPALVTFLSTVQLLITQLTMGEIRQNFRNEG